MFLGVVLLDPSPPVLILQLCRECPDSSVHCLVVIFARGWSPGIPNSTNQAPVPTSDPAHFPSPFRVSVGDSQLVCPKDFYSMQYLTPFPFKNCPKNDNSQHSNSHLV